jgi:hypothetical protein
MHNTVGSSNLFNRWQRLHLEMRFVTGVLWPPLHIAAFFNFADIVEQELKRGVPADLQNKARFTALLQAAHGDSPEAAQVLIYHGAYLQSEAVYGYIAVRCACRNSLSTLPLLLKTGCRVDRYDYHFHHTALHEIAGSVLWHPKILSTLLGLRYISDIINMKDYRGNTALDCATAIDIRSSASRVYDRSYDGIGGIDVLDGWGKKLFTASTVLGHCFSAQGTTALRASHRGWREAGVRTPMDSSYESVPSVLTA